MFFSAKELYQAVQEGILSRQEVLRLLRNLHPNLSLYTDHITVKQCGEVMKMVKDTIVNRADRPAYLGNGGYGKWYRPYNVVRKLMNLNAPEGDYYIGVEVEYGFHSHAGASVLARRLRNWKYVTIDQEGGPYGMEVTFVPVLYSKLGKDSQVFRYVQMLQDNRNLVHQHGAEHSVGTHVCISGHNYNRDPQRHGRFVARITAINDLIVSYSSAPSSLTREEKYLYFGRLPYGAGRVRTKFVEWKLFNSTTDVAQLRKYIEVAKTLYALAEDDNVVIDGTSLRQALNKALLTAERKNRRARINESRARQAVTVQVVGSDAAADETFAVAA